MRRLGYGLLALGSGVALVALLGPLFGGVIDYHVSDDVLNQVMGADAVALFLIAPVCWFAGVLALRGHRAAPIVAMGPAGFAVYTYAQLVMGGEFSTEPGNSEMFFPLFLVLFLLGAGVLITAWNATDADGLPPLAFRRTITVIMFCLAGFLAMGLHLPGLVDVLGGPPNDIGYTQSPTVFWVVKLMDLGIAVPIAVATGLGLLAWSPWSEKAAYAVLVWGAMLGSAVAGMAIVMQINDDPAAVFANVVIMGTLAVAFLTLSVLVLKPLFGTSVSSSLTPGDPGRNSPAPDLLKTGERRQAQEDALR